MSTTLSQGLKTLNVRRSAEAALRNEEITRERVQRLEYRAKRTDEEHERLRTAFADHVNLKFASRFRWLILGR